MGEDVDKVDYHYVEFVAHQVAELLHQAFGALRVIDFVVAEALPAAVALHEGLDQLFLVEILALVLILVHPQVGVHLLDVGGHEA